MRAYTDVVRTEVVTEASSTTESSGSGLTKVYGHAVGPVEPEPGRAEAMPAAPMYPNTSPRFLRGALIFWSVMYPVGLCTCIIELDTTLITYLCLRRDGGRGGLPKAGTRQTTELNGTGGERTRA